MFKSRKSLVKGGLAICLAVMLLVVPLASVFAASTGNTGQPNQSCQAEPMTPGLSVSAPGSAFNPTGVSGTVYAGQQPPTTNNPMAVSQYDVACFQVSQH